MDSLTQAVLGGAVGHAVAGRALGRRAALWGAVAGTVPDLDVLASPLLDTAGQLHFHRGITHGLAFAFVVAPLIGWAAHRAARWWAERRADADRPPARDAGTWRAWTAVWFWALLTHPVLDTFTVYGTQLLAPFSDRPFTVGSVFIIDPLYTVPLAVCLGVAVVRRRPRWAVVGLALSTAYLGWGVGAQQVMRERFERALGPAERLLVTPAPFQTLLWRAEAERGGAVVSAQASLLTRPGAVWTERPSGPLATFPDEVGRTREVQTLRWFSRGWLVADGADADGWTVADPRFGRGPDGAFVFRWRVARDAGVADRLRQLPFEARVTGPVLRQLGRRAVGLGQPPAAGTGD